MGLVMMVSVFHHSRLDLVLFSFIFLSCLTTTLSDGVFGCGGFVKSDVDINYSLVEVKLYTPHGSIKYQTDCAPNTGYYLIPLYDKGDYILKAEPPQGWGFEPTSIELKVDGENDPCSKGEDINFKFTGFSVTGMVVSAGQKSGPANVKVELLTAGQDVVLKSIMTSDGGRFTFTGTMPGEYVVKASHRTWKFSKGQVSVQMKSDNVNIGSDLSISGYDVNGQVTGDGHPMKSVNFVLFSRSGSKVPIGQCQEGAPTGFRSKDAALKPLCYVTSKEDGTFVFPEVPTGSYYLVPFYKGEHITFDVKPDRLDVEVTHDSVTLQTKFEVAGFSVNGKVLDKEGGVGLPKVTVILNGKDQAVSGDDGSYHLENMKRGTYTLSARLQHVAFEEMSVTISPNTPHLPNLVASGFSMCGQVTIDRVPESLGQISTQRRIIYYPEGKGSEAASLVTESTGAFCATVKPGKYVVKVHSSDNEVKSGLLLSPSEKAVTVTSRPVLDVNFSQFRAKLSGSVKCMEKCQTMEVVLDPVGRSDKQIKVSAKMSGNDATFTFDSVMPGKYKASILMDNWCWKERSLEVDVLDHDLSGLEFSHTGYILKCSVSHPITINFAHNKPEKSVGSFLLDKGLNRFCLAHPGVYQLTPDSCHRFDQENYSYDTSNPLTLTLTAVQHLVLGAIDAEVAVNDIRLEIRSSMEDVPTVLGPLKPNATATAAVSKSGEKDGKGGDTVYTFSHWARSGEKLIISAKSADLLFYPEEVTVDVTGQSCPGKVAELVGRKGVFIEGGVTPPLEGVKITISTKDNSMQPVVLKSDGKGKYRLGPLHSGKRYVVEAEKEGYVLTKQADEMSFHAFKLGEISIQMLDDEEKPLPGVLLSLSGDKQFRSNNVTGPDGRITIVGLSPGQYFLRPMMKEYKFEPASQVINVKEGTTETIRIKGARVAFSIFGQVTSLNGEPEPGVIIEAVGTDSCSQYQEESKTEVDGLYRIRGLHPSCKYDVHLKTGEVNLHIERTAPTSLPMQVESSDLRDVNIVAFRRMNQMDISGNVITDLKFLSSLKVRLVNEAQPDSPIHTVSLSKSTFFFLPSLAMDGKLYILSLTSSLSRVEYDFGLPSVEFTANRSHHHLTLDFQPRPRALDHELNQGSFLVLPFFALVVALAYNYKKVIPFASNLYQQLQSSGLRSTLSPSLPSSTAASTIDSGIPQEFLGSDNSPVRKRVKPRRAQ